jgi:signal transduction histidine kinase
MTCCILVAVITFLLYRFTQGILEERLKERLIAIVATASLQIDVDDISKVNDEHDVNTDAYRKLVTQLQFIRNANRNMKYAYLLRPTDDPNIFYFIADADSIDPSAEIDLNQDGEINDEDALVMPGEEYDVSEAHELRDIAPNFPTTDAELTNDQWGTFLSGYAPIKYQGKTAAILGIDVEVGDYLILVRRTFIPFVLFIFFLLLVLSGLTVTLVKTWTIQVHAVEELDRQKDELLSIVSHQLATPVSSIKWYTEMMIDGDLGKITAKQKEHLGAMAGVAVNLSDLVSMILDVSRIQLGRMKIEKQKLDLNDFFHEILDIIKPKAEEKKVKFNVKKPSKLPVAMLDRRYTHMTVENLLSNAVKYTPEGGTVDFDISLKGKTMHIEVRDTGCGIPKQDQEKIFGKLFRASNVRNTVDGNGFGLFVAKGAVEAQGGKIWFQSTEGKGTTFFVDLPVVEK